MTQFIQNFMGKSLDDITKDINDYIKLTSYKVITMTMIIEDKYISTPRVLDKYIPTYRVLVCFEKE